MVQARLIANRRFDFEDGSFWELRVWSVPERIEPSPHNFKYSFVYIVHGERVIGYDNERGKGDHRHFKGVETPYFFHSVSQMLADFLADVEQVRNDTGEDEGRR